MSETNNEHDILVRCAQWCDSQAKSDWYGKSAADMVRAFTATLPSVCALTADAAALPAMPTLAHLQTLTGRPWDCCSNGMQADARNAYAKLYHLCVPLTDAACDVLAERTAHATREGWTSEHDDGEMASAAAAYAASSCGWNADAVRDLWPASWSLVGLKPTVPRRDLVKAGALILAEIERIDRTRT